MKLTMAEWSRSPFPWFQPFGDIGIALCSGGFIEVRLGQRDLVAVPRNHCSVVVSQFCCRREQDCEAIGPGDRKVDPVRSLQPDRLARVSLTAQGPHDGAGSRSCVTDRSPWTREGEHSTSVCE